MSRQFAFFRYCPIQEIWLFSLNFIRFLSFAVLFGFGPFQRQRGDFMSFIRDRVLHPEQTAAERALRRLTPTTRFLPEQFFAQRAPNRIQEGEVKLALAMLFDAIDCCLKYAKAKKPQKYLLHWEARLDGFGGHVSSV